MSEAQVRRLPVIDDRIGYAVSSASAISPGKTDKECAHQALEGVSAPGGQHQQ